MALPLSLYSRDSPASAVVVPGGSICFATASIESSAAPCASPGISEAPKVNDGIRLKWLIWRAPTPSWTFASWIADDERIDHRQRPDHGLREAASRQRDGLARQPFQ